MNAWEKYPHLKKDDFLCPCCKKGEMDEQLLSVLETVARITPLRITSGYRCSSHNKQVGGSENSTHLQGKAVDIAIGSDSQRFLLIKNFILLGINRLGLYNKHNGLHIDVGLQNCHLFWKT